MILILAEKPSVARDIARVIRATTSQDGYFEGNGYQVSWAIGHLVTLPEPDKINPEWKVWKKETLPMLPKVWPLQVVDKTRTQFQKIKNLMKDCTKIICATDAGREGELIFRYIYEAARCNKPVQRLWISSLTPDAIQEGLRKLQSSVQYDSLANAARARSCADWLVGMNLSRAYALSTKQQFFVGRVQTPTLAMIVKRDLEIRNFKPEDYYEIHARFSFATRGPQNQLRIKYDGSEYEAYYIGEIKELNGKNTYLPKKLPTDLKQIEPILDRIKKGKAFIQSVEARTDRQPPPLLYNLTDLQRHANQLFGFPAAKTLELTQTLYEKYKLVSYPRTESRYLSETVAQTLPQIVENIRKPYQGLLVESTGTQPLGPRFVNNQEVTDHHAIIPTDFSAERLRLSEDERKIYDLICRRLLSCWQEDFTTAVTTVLTQAGIKDIFRTYGRVVEQLGWKRLEVKIIENNPFGEKKLPLGLKKDRPVNVDKVKAEQKKTKAPPALTESALLTAMETAGRQIDDRTLAAAMKDSGLGTSATRAGIIEALLSRKYIQRQGKSLVSTEMGEKLIETVHPSVKSPELTARWEKELTQIQNGKRDMHQFIQDLENELVIRVQDALNQKVVGKLPANQKNTEASAIILKTLSQKGFRPAGRLFEEVSQTVANLQRRDFELILAHLSKEGSLRIAEEKFEKDGKVITYRKVSL